MTVCFTDCFKIVKTYSKAGKDNNYLQNQNIFLMQMRQDDGKLCLMNHAYRLLISIISWWQNWREQKFRKL